MGAQKEWLELSRITTDSSSFLLLRNGRNAEVAWLYACCGLSLEVCTPRLFQLGPYWVWIYVIKGQRGHFPFCSCIWAKAPVPLRIQQELWILQSFAKFRTRRKMSYAEYLTFLFLELLSVREIYVVLLRFKANGFQLSQQMYTDTQHQIFPVPLFAWMESSLS